MENLRGGDTSTDALAAHTDIEQVEKPKQNPYGEDIGYIIKLRNTSTKEECDSHIKAVENMNEPFKQYFEGVDARYDSDPDLKTYTGCFHSSVIQFIQGQSIVEHVAEEGWLVEDEDGLKPQES